MKKKPSVQFPIYLNKQKYSALFRKAEKECNTAAPVHDVLDLLLTYYLENTLIIHRRMRAVKDLPEGTPGQKRYHLKTEDLDEKKKIWVRLPKGENRRFTRKVLREGVTKTYVMNLLVDFYLAKEFVIETKIVRVNRY